MVNMQDITTCDQKVCRKCGKEKPIHEFHIDRAQRDSRKPCCRLCTNKVKAEWRRRNGDSVRAKRRESYIRTRETYLAYNRSDRRRERWFSWKLMRRFGITVQQFDDMLEAQAGCCAICGEPPAEASGHQHKHRLHVDHDHATGKVRGLLCNLCNVGLGSFHDDVSLFRKAIKYLKNSGS